MNKSATSLLRVALFLSLLLTVSGLQAAQDTASTAPVAVMPETVYEFPDAVDGEYIIHDFKIQNKGNAVLNVLKVKTT